MTRFLRTARRWLWGSVAVALILAAVLLSAARLALPFAAEYRGEVAQYLSDYLDAAVAIGGLDVEWHRLGPRLRVEDLAVATPTPDAAPARVERAYLELGLGWPREGSWLPLRIRDVVLSGIEMRVALDAGGRPLLGGIRVGDEAERTPSDLARRIAAVERLQVRDARITLERSAREPLVLRDVALRLVSEGERHRVAAQAELPSALGGRLRAALDLRGPPDDFPQWQGSIYLRGNDLDIAAWQELLGPDADLRASGRGKLELWAHWAHGAWQRAQLRGVGRDLNLERAVATAGNRGDAHEAGRLGSKAAFARLEGRLAWTRTEQGWRVDGTDLTVERDGRRWYSTGFSIAHRSGGTSAPDWRGDVDFARIEDVLALARVVQPASFEALPGPWTDGGTARGDVRRLRFATARADAPARVEATVRDLGWAAGDRLPGVRGLDGRLSWRGGDAQVELTTAGAKVRAPELFRGPLPLSDLRGRVEITRDAEGLHVRAPALRAANADVRTTSRLEFTSPSEGKPRIDLEIDFAEGDAAAVHRYLPVGVMKPKLVEWVDRAFVAGRIDRGRVVWRGAIDDFPHETAAGTLEADLEVSDVRLDYAPDWPGLLEGDGRIHLSGGSLAVEASDARLLDTQIRALSATIPDFTDAHLRVQAEARGPLTDLVTVVNESPLEQRLGAFFEGAGAAGAADLAFDVNLPLGDPDAARASGRLRLSGNRFAQPRFGLDLGGLDGAVRFTQDRVHVEGLAATLHGEPVRIDASTHDEPVRRLQVALGGRLEQAALLPGLPPVLADRIEGAAPWNLQVHVPLGPERREQPLVVRGTSDLVGTAVDLPAPLGKSADERRVLHFDFPVARDGGLEPGRISYGDGLEAELALAGRRGDLRLETGRVRLGPGALGAGGPESGGDDAQEGVRLRGRIADVDLGAWAEVLRTASAAESEGDAPVLADADLQIGQARFSGYGVSDIRLRAGRAGADWRIDLDGDQLAGRVHVPGDTGQGAQPVRVRLTRLAPNALEGEESDSPVATDPPVDPAHLPPLDLRVEHLALPMGPLRQVALVAVPIPNGLAIRRLGFTNPELELAGSGHWRGAAHRPGAAQETALSLTLRSDNFGAGLAPLGLGGALGRGDGRVTADLEWMGPPWAPELAALAGQVRVRLADGVFKPVDPGIARVFGLLDLRGMLEYGFQFSEFTGRIDIADGHARTDDLTVDGSAGRLRVRGRTDLVAQQYDHVVEYRPELKRSLPLFGALAGGPTVGLSVALVQSLLRNLGADMESAAELTYRLTGPWDAPNVERVTTDPNGPARNPRSTGSGGRR